MIRRISILMHFPGDANPIDVSSLYRDGTAHFAERLFNEDKHSVQDTFRCALKHDQGIVDKFRSARGKIKVVVLDAADSSGLFSGVIEPSTAQASHQVNEDLVLEAVDATWRLDDPVAEAFQFPATIDAAPLKVCDYSDVAHSIFHQVCLLAGYTLGEIVAGAENHAPVRHCAARAGEESYREFLDGLLSEHGLVLDDDGLGRLTTRRWTRADAGYDMTLDGDDLSVVEPVVWARRYIPEDGVRLEWSEAKVIDDALLFRDSLPVSAQGEFTGQPIAPGDYYPADSDIEDVYQDYVERWLDRPYLERATRLKNKDLSLITTDQAQVVFQAETGIVKESEAFEWSRAKVRFQNVSAAIKKMLSFEVRGRALIRSSIKSITAPENAKNPRTVTSRFLFNEASAIAYANAQALDIEYADFEYTFGLNRYLESGTVVRLINQKNNIDTRAIIQDCEFDIGRPVYRYKAIGLAEESSVASTSSVSSGTAAWPYLNSIDAKMASYAQNVPPTNNVTNLAFASEQNPSGMIDVTVSWDYTQGASPADGFLVFYKRDVTTPGAIDIFRDPSVFVPASSAAEYQTILTLPARQAGAGTLPIHYRFGVVAFGTRRSGTVVHLAGVVEDPAWIDKTFASKIQVDGNNYWDQDTGEMRVGSADKYIHVRPAEGRFDIHSVDLELTNAELITNIKGVELSHEGNSHVWRNVSDKKMLTSISAIGHGGIVLAGKRFEVAFQAPARMEAWTAPTAAVTMSMIQLEGVFRVAYRRSTDGALVEQTTADFITYSSQVVIDPDSSSDPCYARLRDGRLLIVYRLTSGNQLTYRMMAAGVWGSAIAIETPGYDPTIVTTVAGETRMVYRGVIAIKERVWDGAGWGAPSTIEAVNGIGPSIIEYPNGTLRLSYVISQTVRERLFINGQWGAAVQEFPAVSRLSYLVTNEYELYMYYLIPTTQRLARRKFGDAGWSSEELFFDVSCSEVKGLQVNTGDIIVGHIRSTGSGLFVSHIQTSARPGAGIIESGQNSNGSYVKFSDGTLVQSGFITSYNALATVGGGWKAINMPMAATSRVSLSVIANNWVGASGKMSDSESAANQIQVYNRGAYTLDTALYWGFYGKWR